MNVQPDLEFIKYLKGAGGDTLKKCYQCATCSVVCPLSTDTKPFPRKEMIWAQWGLKEKLVADPDVFLCHNCGDCTAYCPRGAKPGDVLGAIRAYAYTFYGWPSGFAKLASSSKGLPMLIAIPSVIIFVLWLVSGGLSVPSAADFSTYGYQRFFGHWDFHWLTKNVFVIDLIMLSAAGLAVVSAYKGVSKMWKGMEENAGIKGDFRPSCVQFVKEFLWPSVQEIVQHTRFRECKENIDRVQGHLPLMLSFIGLFIVTVWSATANDVLALIPALSFLHGPMSVWNPVKILANISAVAMIVGIGILWMNRSRKESEKGLKPTFYDWFLIWEIMAVGATGLLAEIARWAGLPALGYIIYFIHLVSVMMLFLYMPYTKFAHLVYRTFAMAFERYRESAFGKNPVNM
ncbi:MAG: quinone-interacting membrane-bound oxidoreductase complex subunit QmoC [Desulfocapsaceae bacterium]|nr:quinone-interacting membrane-bound oxidoreductase complex subunit QmoC [Desulfocapsaceae bacterium]